jgi:hypothetical protein
MPEKLPITVDELRKMIGISVHYRGFSGSIVEVLEDGPSLVLQCMGNNSIQHNLHGHPTRRSPETITVRVLSENGKSLHRDFLELELSE